MNISTRRLKRSQPVSRDQLFPDHKTQKEKKIASGKLGYAFGLSSDSQTTYIFTNKLT